MNKKCNYCKNIFITTKKEKSYCSLKCRLKRKQYRINNKDMLSEKAKKYYLSNKEKYNKLNKLYRMKNKKRIYAKIKEWNKNHKDHIKTRSKLYYLKNKEKMNKNRREYYIKHKEKILKQNANWAINNKEKNRARKNLYERIKIQNDINFRIKKRIQNRIRTALKGKRKFAHTFELLGYNINELKYHLEKQFKSGMSWENYGKWHIDHIKPCSSFDLSKPFEQLKCFNYKNLQPLWAHENLIKGDKY